jgi:hypothetical protein
MAFDFLSVFQHHFRCAFQIGGRGRIGIFVGKYGFGKHGIVNPFVIGDIPKEPKTRIEMPVADLFDLIAQCLINMLSILIQNELKNQFAQFLFK